jgi:hypothetical protein
MDPGQVTDRRPARRPSPAVFLLVAALALVPWIGWLAASLPCSYRSQHWGIAWAGFDAGLALVLGLTGFAALRRAPWLEQAAVAAAALLVADAWFDVVTSRGAGAITVAVAEALAIELPIAVFCLRLARAATPPPQPGAPQGERRASQLLPASRAQLRLSPHPASAPSDLSPSRAGSSLTPKERFTMNRCDLCVRDLDPLVSFAAARWELLTFHEVRDLLRGSGRDRFVVLYDGDAPDIDGWCGRLTELGFPASRIHKLNDTGATAS